ncbi:MAG: polysaccharide deacetylase family protein [Ginsengibacter sp.]
MSNNGNFTISLDFELYWGMRDVVTIENYSENIRNVHVVIPKILHLFQEYEIHATWAIVGFLYAKDKVELLSIFPKELPQYTIERYNPYDYIDSNPLEKEFHFAPECIKLIKQTPYQEIATHTLSHYYALEQGQTAEQFKSDLDSAIKVQENEIRSIVFPRNQYDSKSLEIAGSAGLRFYRGNPGFSLYKSRMFKEENNLIRIFRFMDAYINLSGQNTFIVDKNVPGMVNVPASKFLRPYSKRLSFLEELKFRRIKNAMVYAAKKKENYHLWWHPHNFGKDTEKNLVFLEKILIEFRWLKNQYGFESKSIGEY